jgi:hypothetical protein
MMPGLIQDSTEVSFDFNSGAEALQKGVFLFTRWHWLLLAAVHKSYFCTTLLLPLAVGSR